MFTKIFILYLIVFSPILNSQSEILKMLEKEISSIEMNEKKVNIYKKFIKKIYWNRYKCNDLNIIAKQFLNFVKKKNIKKEFVYAYSDYAFSLEKIGEFKKAERIIKKANKLIRNENDIEKKLYFFNALFYIYSRRPNNNKKLELANKIRFLYKKKGDINNEALFIYIGANLLMTQGMNKNRLNMYKKAFDLYKKVGNQKKMVLMYDYIGLVNIELGYYDKALEIFYNGLELGEKIKDFENSGRICLKIGDLFLKRKDYNKAYSYYKKAGNLFSHLKEKKFFIWVNKKIGLYYYTLKKYKNSLVYFKQSLKKQLEYYKYSNIKVETGLLYTYIYIGQIYIQLNNIEKAKKNFNKALKFGLESKAFKPLAEVYNGFGNLYYAKKKHIKSINKLLKSIKYTKKIKDNILLKENYKLLYQNYEILKDFKNALKYHKLYFDLERKIFNEKNTKNLADIETKYETEKKDTEIKNLKKINEMKEREKKLLFREKNLIKNQQRYMIYAVLMGAFMLLVFLFFLIKKYKLLNAFWKKKNFVGKYKLDEKIASGGMGIVYKAYDILDKDKKNSFAIKVLREEYFEDEAMKKRFKFEGNMIDQIDHKNIVKVFERGESVDSHYLVMEYLEGRTLAEYIKETGKVEIAESLSIMIQTVNAVKTIHSKGIIHRDLKPENIMLIKEEDSEKPLVKLLDFGLAKSETMTKMTMTGMVMGTSNYISPEQLTGDKLTFSSDIYSLGVIFYEMLSGERLFAGNTEEAVFHKILEQERIPIIEKRPDISINLNDLIMKMIDRDIDKRPETNNILNIIEGLKPK